MEGQLLIVLVYIPKKLDNSRFLSFHFNGHFQVDLG